MDQVLILRDNDTGKLYTMNLGIPDPGQEVVGKINIHNRPASTDLNNALLKAFQQGVEWAHEHPDKKTK